MKVPANDPRLGASILEALPHPTFLVDAERRVVHANAAGRGLFGAEPGATLASALGCAEAAASGCGSRPSCSGCVIVEVVRRALAGERARVRAFLLRTGADGKPADLHLLVAGSPFQFGGAAHALLVLEDVDQILADPGVVRVCGACGRVEDEEGEWYPLHRYLEDRLGLEASEALCPACARRVGRGG